MMMIIIEINNHNICAHKKKGGRLASLPGYSIKIEGGVLGGIALYLLTLFLNALRLKKALQDSHVSALKL